MYKTLNANKHDIWIYVEIISSSWKNCYQIMATNYMNSCKIDLLYFIRNIFLLIYLIDIKK